MNKPITRREMLAMFAAGAVMTAEGLWLPGRKLISIPKLVDPLRCGVDLAQGGDTVIISLHSGAAVAYDFEWAAFTERNNG